MDECSTYSTNPFCFCINKNRQSVPQYKQYDANFSNVGQGFKCCNKTHILPSHLAEYRTINDQYSSVIDYLTDIQLYNKSCDYSVYFNNNSDYNLQKDYPDLFDHAKHRMEIFNAFFTQHNYSSITNNSELVPDISSNTITCPTDFIPQILSYQDDSHNKDQYIYVCVNKNNQRPSLDFQYKLISFYDVNENNCKEKQCITKENPTIGSHSIGEDNYKSNNYKNNSTQSLIIGMVILGVILLFVLIYYLAIKHKGRSLKSTVKIKSDF